MGVWSEFEVYGSGIWIGCTGMVGYKYVRVELIWVCDGEWVVGGMEKEGRYVGMRREDNYQSERGV